MNEKIKTALWFARRPSHWAHAYALGTRRLRPDRDGAEQARAASGWAAARAVSVDQALTAVGLLARGSTSPPMPAALLTEGNERARRSSARMGGPGDVNLIHAAVKLSGAQRIIETGVAYGWSSLAILAALEGRGDARLVSVDMPYPKMNNEDFVGIVVPERLRGPWQIVREPDRRGLEKAIARHGGTIDFCHYDSDKSWWGRRYAYPLLWNALAPGGVFISDDIQDNMAFAEFVAERGVTVAVTAFETKFVGIARKP
jgi:predicted O-methyltransferase YrrM